MKILLVLALFFSSLLMAQEPTNIRFDALILQEGNELVEYNWRDCRIFGGVSYRPIDGNLVLSVEFIDCRDTLFADGFEDE